MSKRDLIVPAAEANRSFSKLLRMVREGGRITITSHGEPVAVLGPPGSTGVERLEALEVLETHWASVTPVVAGAWTRDEIYGAD